MTRYTFFDPERATTPTWRRSLWVALGLVYLVIWPSSELFGHHHPAGWIVVRLLALLSFVALFIALVVAHNPWKGTTRPLTWVFLGAVAAMTVSYPLLFGRDWIALTIYLGVACAMAFPHRWAGRGVFGATALCCALCLLAGVPGNSTLLLTFETLTIGLLMLAFRTSRILVAQLHEARGEVARLAANEERLRIARDLHDLLGHTLSLIVLKSEVAVRLAGRDPEKSLAEVTDIETIARQALGDVREAVSGYRQRNLTDELDNARAVLDAAGVELTIRSQGTPLPDQVDGLFGWAVREGVTNIVRHARASCATISVSRQDDSAVLTVTDDGAGGLDTGSGLHQPGELAGGPGTGSGLRGLGERVAAWGGTVQAGPRPGGGFGLTVRAPVTEPAPSEPQTADR